MYENREFEANSSSAAATVGNTCLVIQVAAKRGETVEPL